jgi:Sulfotransferase family
MKPLKLIHITKTAGTSIEDIGKKHGINWGRYDTEYKTPRGIKYHDYFTNVDKNIQNKYDWFMVVRNPYDRILSEYYCKYGGIGLRTNKNTSVIEMNRYIINKIDSMKQRKYGDHYSPQHLYLDTSKNIHILKFENLEKEFNELMKKYNLNITLNMKSNESIKQYSVKDFSNTLIKLINEVYAKDFELFGYDKIIPNVV